MKFSKSIVFTYNNSNFTIEAQTMYKIKRVIAVLNNDLRFEILNHLKKGEQTVTELFIKFRIEQAVMSGHLLLMRKANLVEYERRGKQCYYKIKKDGYSNLKKLLQAVSTAHSIRERAKEGFIIFRVLSHDIRLEILEFIYNKKQTYVHPIYHWLGLEQSITSGHLGLFRELKMITSEQKGKHVLYFLSEKNIEFFYDLQKAVEDFEKVYGVTD